MSPFSRHVLRRAAWAVLAAPISACLASSRIEGGLPSGAVPLTAPVVFREWYQRTEACSGLRGGWDSLQWYVVPGVSMFTAADGPVVGLWTRSRTSGVIILAGNFVDDELVVRHEMLHALIGKTGHPPELFGTRCHLTWDTWAAESSRP